MGRPHAEILGEFPKKEEFNKLPHVELKWKCCVCGKTIYLDEGYSEISTITQDIGKGVQSKVAHIKCLEDKLSIKLG